MIGGGRVDEKTCPVHLRNQFFLAGDVLKIGGIIDRKEDVVFCACITYICNSIWKSLSVSMEKSEAARK